MKTQSQHVFLMFALLTIICVGITSFPATAEEVSYFFDFEDPVVPEILETTSFAFSGNPTETVTCEVEGGYLRIHDVVPAACGMYLQPTALFTDTHLSAVVNPDGGLPREFHFLAGRDMTVGGMVSGYGCYLWRQHWTNQVEFAMHKTVNGSEVYTLAATTVDPGPYLMEFDVVDRKTAEGIEYTEFTARLTSSDGQESIAFYAQDHGNLGGRGRLESGHAVFGAFLGPDQRNKGWILDATFDNVNITGTRVGGPALEGDLNSDGSVNSTDLDIVRANWGQSVSPQTNGDADGDGVVASGDLDIVRANWGATAAASVPEPAFLALGSLAAALFLARRRVPFLCITIPFFSKENSNEEARVRTVFHRARRCRLVRERFTSCYGRGGVLFV